MKTRPKDWQHKELTTGQFLWQKFLKMQANGVVYLLQHKKTVEAFNLADSTCARCYQEMYCGRNMECPFRATHDKAMESITLN